MEQWRNFLQEGRYEAATTEMTRKVIPFVKELIRDSLPKEVFQAPNPRDDQGLHTVRPVVFSRDIGTLPKELEDKMSSVGFNFSIDPKLYEETGNKYSIGGAFGRDPEMPEWNFLIVNSHLDPSFSEADLNDYLADLKGTTIHEIQHGGQTEDVFQTGSPQYSNPMGGYKFDYDRIDGLRGYYASEAEVDSYTKEIYKKAKYHKKSFPEIMDARIQEFYDMFERRFDKMTAEDERETPGETRIKYTKEEMHDFFFKELRDIFITAAKKKYPEAQGI
jgi:hypothetical protein